MHDIDTTRLESEPLSLRQEIEASEFEFLDAGELESPLSEVEEMELASELLAVAKKALPFLGGALGSIIPIPGVGTAVGTALGSAASKVLKAELEGLSPEDREFEMARRFVRFAGTAAKTAASTPPGATARAGIIAALKAALEQQRAQLADGKAGAGRNGEFGFEEIEELKERAAPLAAPTAGGRSRNGRWIRRGGKIILLGV